MHPSYTPAGSNSLAAWAQHFIHTMTLREQVAPSLLEMRVCPLAVFDHFSTSVRCPAFCSGLKQKATLGCSWSRFLKMQPGNMFACMKQELHHVTAAGAQARA